MGSLVPPFRPIAPGTTTPSVPAFVSLPASIVRIPTMNRVQPATMSAPQAFQAVLQQANRRFQVTKKQKTCDADMCIRINSFSVYSFLVLLGLTCNHYSKFRYFNDFITYIVLIKRN